MSNLNVLDWRDLASILDAIPPKDHKTTADARKCIGAIEQIRKEIKPELKELEDLQNKSAEIARPYQEKLRELGDSPENEKKKKKIQDEANVELKPLNDEFAELVKKFKEQEVTINLDENYKAYIKSIFEDKIKPMYNKTADMLKIADLLGI